MSDGKIRIRFGLKAFSLFPNAGVFVIYIPNTKFGAFRSAVDTIKTILEAVGRQDVASKIVFELGG